MLEVTKMMTWKESQVSFVNLFCFVLDRFVVSIDNLVYS